MARIFITGSSAGLGQMAAELLINQGHQVVLHAGNEKRAGRISRYLRTTHWSSFFVRSKGG